VWEHLFLFLLLEPLSAHIHTDTHTQALLSLCVTRFTCWVKQQGRLCKRCRLQPPEKNSFFFIPVFRSSAALCPRVFLFFCLLALLYRGTSGRRCAHVLVNTLLLHSFSFSVSLIVFSPSD
jgi:hypothetical protein